MSSNLHRNLPCRAKHLGSLLHPDDPLKTRADLDNGNAQQQQLTSIEDAPAKDIVDTHIKLGFHLYLHDEYRWHSTFPASAIHLMSMLSRLWTVLGHLLPRLGRLQVDQEL